MVFFTVKKTEYKKKYLRICEIHRWNKDILSCFTNDNNQIELMLIIQVEQSQTKILIPYVVFKIKKKNT